MFYAEQLISLIIEPTLESLNLCSDDAIELLVFTCAVESLGGTYLKQTNGKALGIYQIEPNTYKDIWNNFIKNKFNLTYLMRTKFDAAYMPYFDRLIYDLKFSTAIARIHYYRVSEPLPSSKDVDAIWEYYKKYYNTDLGKAQKQLSINKYIRFISN